MKNDRIQSWFGVTYHWNSVAFDLSCHQRKQQVVLILHCRIGLCHMPRNIPDILGMITGAIPVVKIL